MTTGNISQLLMRLVMKAEFIERRSMQFFAHHHDFLRMFNEEFLEVDWINKKCGEENMIGQIQKFFGRKIGAGMIEIPSEAIEEFHDEIKGHLDQKATDWAAVAAHEIYVHGWSRKGDKATENAEFFKDMADTLHTKINNMCIGDTNKFIWKI